MQKNLYFRTMYRRRNLLKEAVFGLFNAISPYPKLAMEVFIRKNFGERYFNLASAITVAAILLLLPMALHKGSALPMLVTGGGYPGYGTGGEGQPSFWGKYATWYLYLVAFVYFSVKRWKEVRHNPSVFDFERFSLYSGDIDSRFFRPPFIKNTPTVRRVEILYEPALFFIIGLFLWLLGQSLGWLLVIGSIIYSISYAAMYKQGDDFITDKIDEMILNEELEDALVGDLDASQTRGVRLYFDKPGSEELRRKVAPTFLEKDDDLAVAI